VGLVLFVLLGLSFGLDAAWSYVVASGVLIAVAAAADQFLNRSDRIPEEEEHVREG